MTKVAVDLDALRKKLDKSLRKKGDKKKEFGPSVFFFPENTAKAGKPELFRLLPWPDHPEMPIKELNFYYGVRPMEEVNGKSQKIKALLSLRQFGEEDPIQEAIDELRKRDGKTPEQIKADEELAKKLYPTTVYYFLGLVRGKEEEGPKIWQTQSKKIYQKIINAFINEAKWGNILDFEAGRDMEVYHDPDKERDKTDIDFAIEKSVVWTDMDQLEEWLTVEKMPDPVKLMAKRKKSYNELREVLDKWLSEGTSASDDDEEEHQPEESSKKEEKEVKTEKKETSKKRSAKEAFAELENDDDDE